MNTNEAIRIVWDYMHLGHSLKKADAIMALGSYDIRVAEHAAKLWLDGWAPYLICAGSGTVHSDSAVWQRFVGSTEAEVFADIARKEGVPERAILIENKSQNTGQNYEFTISLLKEKGVVLERLIAAHPPAVYCISHLLFYSWLLSRCLRLCAVRQNTLEPSQYWLVHKHWRLVV